MNFLIVKNFILAKFKLSTTDSASVSLIKSHKEKRRDENQSPHLHTVMASASFSAISYRFRSKEPIFTSKASSFVSTALTGRRVFGSIRAAQVTSHENPRRRTQNAEGDIFVGK